MLSAVDDYVIGHCLRRRCRQRTMQAMGATAAEESDWPGSTPRSLLGRRGGQMIPAVPPEADFERGLDRLLDGTEAIAASGGRHDQPRLMPQLPAGVEAAVEAREPR